MKADNLPAQLQERGLFCCWRYETRKGSDKPTKVPYNPRTGGRAQNTNSLTFSPLAVALEAVERGGYDGIGVGVFGTLGAIDIDHCLDENGALSGMAEDIIAIMGTYTEFSPSGHGLRILFTVPDGFQYDKARYYINNQKLGLEVYIAGATQKYVTVTGNTFTPGMDLEERGAQLAEVLEKYMIRPKAAAPAPPARSNGPLEWGAEIGRAVPAALEDMELIERAKRSKNGTAFGALWAGDITGYKSASEADIALCNALAFWTNRDAERVDRLFRQSGLYRPEKWDRPTAGSTYGALTIQNAINTAQTGYCPEEYRKQTAAQDFPTCGDIVPFEPFEPPDTSKLPSFPVEQFPPVLRDFVQAVADNVQVAVDMPALQVLASMALCIQGKFVINPKPGWVEPLNLYAVTVARPSDRKSPTVQACTWHLREWVREENARRRPLVDEYNTKRAVLVKQITSMIERVSKPPKGAANSATVGTSDILELQHRLADLEQDEVKYLRLMADDVTPEALVSLMAENGGKMAIVSDEGGIFDIAAGRYSDRVNLDAFLKAYSGTAIQIDRKGRPPENIDHPALTMSLTVQPSVLETIMGNADFSGRGFLARFLYSLPASTVGHRSFETGGIPFPVEIAYDELLDTLLNIEDTGEARIIKLSPEAYSESKRFFEALEPRLLNDLEEIEEWAGKYHGQIMRIAGIMHCCLYGEAAEREPVSLDTIQRAQTIGAYFLEHAMAAFRVMGLADRPEEKDAKYILKRLEADGRMELSKRELFHLCKGRLKRTEDLEPGLKILTERGYLAVESIKTGERGRPTERISLTPEYQKYQNPQK